MRKRTKWIILILSVAIIGTISYYGYSIINFGLSIQEDPSDSRFSQFHEEEQDETVQPPEWEGKERVNILLLGGDSRGLSRNEAPRSDTLMIASIDPITKQAHLFSILRDTYTDIPGYHANRINAALSLGGPNLSMKAVSEFVGIPIHYYVYIDFEGFIAMIDSIGGIEFEVEKDMKYTDPSDNPEYNIDLKKGLQHLDGHMALQYVRFRHDRLSDFTRTERQRNFMQAVAQKMRSNSSLIKLPSTLEKIEPFIETNLSIGEMWSLASLGYKVKSETLVSDQLPPNSLLREDNINGADVITVDPDQLQDYVQNQFELAEKENIDMSTVSQEQLDTEQ